MIRRVNLCRKCAELLEQANGVKVRLLRRNIDKSCVCDECGHRFYCNTYEIGVGKEQT